MPTIKQFGREREVSENSPTYLRRQGQLYTGKPMVNGKVVSNDEFNRYWTQQFKNDPEMRRLLDENKRKGGSEKSRELAATERAIALGWRPPNKDFSVDFDKGGYRSERANAYTRNSDWILPLAAGVATLGIPAIAAVAGGAGAAGAGAAGTAASTATPTLAGVTAGSTVGLPGAAATLGAAPGITGGTAATIAGAAPAAAGATAGGAGAAIPGGFWTKAAISLGVDAFKTYMSNRASGKANEALQKGNQQAIDLYGQALSPYMNLGSQAANALGAPGGLMGFNMGGLGGATAAPAPGLGGTAAPSASRSPGSTGHTAPPGAVPTGTAVPRPAMVDPQGMGLPALSRTAQAQQQSRSSFVPMIAPDGEEGELPAEQVAAAEAAGFKRRTG